MNKIKINVKMIVKLLIVFLSVVAVLVVGNILQDKIPFRNGFLVIVLVLLVINIVSNLIINIKDLKEIKKKKSGEELINLLLQTKEEALKDPEVVRVRILKKYNKIRLYSFITLGLMYLVLFLCSYTFFLSYLFIIIILVYFFSIINSKRKEELGSSEEIINSEMNEEEFKELYEIVGKVTKYHNVNKKYKIMYTYDANLGIVEKDDYIFIIVGYINLRSLTKEELEAALHHEIAHFINKDTDYSLKFSKLSSNINHLSNSIFYILFYPKINSLTFETEMLNYLSTIFYERKADDIVNQVGCNEQFINGLAKICVYGLYYNQYLEETNLGRFESVQYDLLNKGYNDFLRYYNNNLEFINIFLEKSVVGRFDTHPSIVERKERLNVNKINISFENDELKQYADLIEKRFINDNKTKIEEQYKNCREIYLKVLKDYDNVNENSTQEELISLGLDLFNLSLYSKALIICDRVLDINPNQGRACFIKGAILLNLYHNEEGVKYLFKIIEENYSEYLQDAIYIVGTYYSSIGNMEGIEKLRSVQASTIDNYSDYDELSKISQNDRLENVVDDEGIKNVLEIVNNTCATNVVVAKKTLNNKSMIHVIVIFNDDEKAENVDDISNKIWRTLDAINDIDYYLRTIPNKYYKNLKWLHKFEVYTKK